GELGLAQLRERQLAGGHHPLPGQAVAAVASLQVAGGVAVLLSRQGQRQVRLLVRVVAAAPRAHRTGRGSTGGNDEGKDQAAGQGEDAFHERVSPYRKLKSQVSPM